MRLEKHLKREAEVITPILVEHLRGGCQQAFKTVYLHYYGSLENFLCSLLRNREEAREVAQEVFMTIWERRSKLDPQRNIRNFIYTIARNAVMNRFCHERVVRRYALSAPHQTHDHTSEEIFIARETELIVRLAVERMPRMRRKVFELSHYEGMSNGEIAKLLGIATPNVANHLSQARKEIKGALTSFLFFIAY